MPKNAYLDAKIGFDPAEHEPQKECWDVAVDTSSACLEPARMRRPAFEMGPSAFKIIPICKSERPNDSTFAIPYRKTVR